MSAAWLLPHCNPMCRSAFATLLGVSVIIVLLLIQRLYKRLLCRGSRHLNAPFTHKDGELVPHSINLESGWSMKAASSMKAERIAAHIPGTVLSNLIAHNIFPDPNVGLQHKCIPDIYHVGRDFYTYCFTTSFLKPATWDPLAGCRALLTLHGICYAASVQVNGQEVARDGELRGMFLRHGIDITEQVASAKKVDNMLEITIRPPDHVGCVDRGGQGGDHDIAKDCTAQFVEGWDWIVPVPDRNTGIWDDVTISWTGPVRLQDLYARSERASASCPITEAAMIRSEVTLVNHSTTARKGHLRITIDHCEPSTRDSGGSKPHEHPWGIRKHGTKGADDKIAGQKQRTFRAAEHIRADQGQKSNHPREQQSRVDARARHSAPGKRGLSWIEPVSVPQGRTRLDLRDHLMRSPQLWWPLNMGEQNLYSVRVSLYLESFGLSDEATERFGIMDISSVEDPELSGHVFYVNAERVFIRGGNYIASDMLLRASKQRYHDEVRMHAEMGLNMIRLWGGAGATRTAFYDACDEAGILVWQEFCITGDCNGRGSTPDSPLSKHCWPLDHDLFIRSAADTVRRLRNHACIALWCGGNEQTPAADLDAALQIMLPRRPAQSSHGFGQVLVDKPCQGDSRWWTCPGWRGQKESALTCLDASRAYVSGSLWSGFGEGHGAFSDGPYGCQSPAAFFHPAFYPYAFNPEVGSVGVPEYETMRKIFPDPAQAAFPRFTVTPSGLVQESPKAAWQLHTYITYSTGSSAGAAGNEILTYGQPQSLEDFCSQAQIANYVQYRALLEGWASFMWRRFSGVLIWKTQNPWAGLRGQLYDWLLAPTGGYYGVMLACEAVHVQLNLYSCQVEVVNTSRRGIEGATLSTTVFLVNRHGTHLIEAVSHCVPNVAANSVTVTAQCSNQAGSEGVTFVFLWLRAASGELISRNVYWLPDRQTGACEELRPWSLRHTVALAAEVVSLTYEAGALRVQICIVNENSLHPAFWVRLALQAPSKGKAGGLQEGRCAERILPVFWSGNYHTIAPREAMVVSVEARVDEKDLPVDIVCEGWNTSSLCMRLSSTVA